MRRLLTMGATLALFVPALVFLLIVPLFLPGGAALAETWYPSKYGAQDTLGAGDLRCGLTLRLCLRLQRLGRALCNDLLRSQRFLARDLLGLDRLLERGLVANVIDL